MMTFAKNLKSLSSKLQPWTPLSVDEPFWTCVRARPAKKRACKQHRLFKNQFEGQKRVQHGHFTQKWYVTHATVKKNGTCARARHRARARDIRNCLNMLVEHKWLYLQKTRSLYLQNCDREPLYLLMNLFGHVCARALPKNALVSSIDCSKINFKVRNVFSMVFLPGIDMSHMLLWKKMVRARARGGARARTYQFFTQ